MSRTCFLCGKEVTDHGSVILPPMSFARYTEAMFFQPESIPKPKYLCPGCTGRTNRCEISDEEFDRLDTWAGREENL